MNQDESFVLSLNNGWMVVPFTEEEETWKEAGLEGVIYNEVQEIHISQVYLVFIHSS